MIACPSFFSAGLRLAQALDEGGVLERSERLLPLPPVQLLEPLLQVGVESHPSPQLHHRAPRRALREILHGELAQIDCLGGLHGRAGLEACPVEYRVDEVACLAALVGDDV